MDNIKPESQVLLVYEKVTSPQFLEEFVKKLETNSGARVTAKSLDSLQAESYPPSNFDAVICGCIPPYICNYSDATLSYICKIVKPSAPAIFECIESDGNTHFISNFISLLKLTGFINISEVKTIEVSNELQNVHNIKEGLVLYEFVGFKPPYEIGSSAPLKLNKKMQVSAVWKLDDMDDDVDTIDPDELLDEDDLKKPEPSSLRVCGTTGKRKACRDCSCGLAEELQEETNKAKVVNKIESLPKSSCGSCYLGDAFRCATCPYLGMPAFKPGEKIQLSGNQLQADV